MMSRYTTKQIQLDELYLDEKNPRFIVPPNPSQQSIVDYLIENEEVAKALKDLFPDFSYVKRKRKPKKE